MSFNQIINIGDRRISNYDPCFIIAEAGVNHNGDLQRAKEMIEVAADCGVDAIKFQSFVTKELILSNVGMAEYQKANLKQVGSQFDMLKKLEVPAESMIALKEFAESKGLVFLTTPFDEVSLDELDICNLEVYKVASTDTTNLSFLRKIARKNKPLILSTGMTYMSEIQLVVEDLKSINQDIILLHCTSNYPTPPDEVNLNIIRTFQREFEIITGFSDHTEGLGASPYAVGLGAKVIEKHFTLDKNLPGPDHKASLEPNELIELVRAIREAESYMGVDIKYPTLSELGTRASLQKSILARKTIKKGDEFSEANLNTKRAGGQGIPAIYIDQLIGKKATRNYSIDDIIQI